MPSDKFRTLLYNVAKGFFMIWLCNLVAYFLYFFFLNRDNTEFPTTASFRTVIFSLIAFAISMIIYVKIDINIQSSNPRIINEEERLKKLFIDSNYTIDYNAYFKNQIKTRLWGYYLIAFLYQIPLIINYILVSFAAENINIYQSPIGIFKWNMTNIFAYEFLGDLWFFGPFIYLGLFISIFTAAVYKEQKKWLVKPSYID